MTWDLVDFAARHQIAFEQAVTHRFAIEEGPAAYRLFDAGKTGKVIFEWE